MKSGEFVLTERHLQRLISSILEAGPNYRVKVKGHGFSMNPFIKNNDTLTLKPVDPLKGVKIGDVVAVSNSQENKLIIHRIIRSKSGRFQTKGDNNPNTDPWCSMGDIIGIVHEITGNGWTMFRCKHWQNVLIAFASKTGLLNRILYPGYIYLRKFLK